MTQKTELFFNEISNYQKRLEEQILQIEKELSSLPPGTLHIHQDKMADLP